MPSDGPPQHSIQQLAVAPAPLLQLHGDHLDCPAWAVRTRHCTVTMLHLHTAVSLFKKFPSEKHIWYSWLNIPPLLVPCYKMQWLLFWCWNAVSLYMVQHFKETKYLGRWVVSQDNLSLNVTKRKLLLMN